MNEAHYSHETVRVTKSFQFKSNISLITNILIAYVNVV